jgi:hypothetical protein
MAESDCAINHNAELAIPQWLCRTCNPELNLTDEQWNEQIERMKKSQALQRS